jgi:hypothetical protein
MTRDDLDLGASLCFLAPGLAHQLANALFRVQGHAELLAGADAEVQRERRAILEGVERAAHPVQLLQWLLGDDAQPPSQAGILMNRLCECLPAPLRERGLRLETRHSSHETPVSVDGTLFTRGLLATLLALLRHAPDGCGGTLQLDLLAQETTCVRVRVQLQPQPSQLPFRIDTAACAGELQDRLAKARIQVSAIATGNALQLVFPAAATPATLCWHSPNLHNPT